MPMEFVGLDKQISTKLEMNIFTAPGPFVIEIDHVENQISQIASTPIQYRFAVP